MPLYTVRVKLVQQPAIQRGSNLCEFSLHFHGISDAGMMDDMDDLADTFSAVPQGGRWTCERSSVAIHELQVYRRNIADVNEWNFVGSHAFAINELPTISQTIDIYGVPISFDGYYQAKYAHRRGAVLVIQDGVDPGHRRRVYVGPLSDHYEILTTSVIGLDVITAIGDNSVIDGPMPSPTDSVDYWRIGLADDVADWLSTVSDVMPSASSVVPSFKLGTWSLLESSRASYVRAEMRSRGVRGALGTPFP